MWLLYTDPSGYQIVKCRLLRFACFHQKQPPGLFYNKGIFKTFAIFTGKYLCWSLFLIKLRTCKAAISKNICFKIKVQRSASVFTFKGLMLVKVPFDKNYFEILIRKLNWCYKISLVPTLK